MAKNYTEEMLSSTRNREAGSQVNSVNYSNSPSSSKDMMKDNLRTVKRAIFAAHLIAIGIAIITFISLQNEFDDTTSKLGTITNKQCAPSQQLIERPVDETKQVVYYDRVYDVTVSSVTYGVESSSILYCDQTGVAVSLRVRDVSAPTADPEGVALNMFSAILYDKSGNQLDPSLKSRYREYVEEKQLTLIPFERVDKGGELNGSIIWSKDADMTGPYTLKISGRTPEAQMQITEFVLPE